MDAEHSLLRLAAQISRKNPLLGYELEHSVRSLAAVQPGTRSFEQTLESMMGLLKTLRKDLKKSLEDIEDSEEFAKFFDDASLDENFRQFQKLVDKASKSAVSRAAAVAGPMDWIKNKLKPSDKKPAKKKEKADTENSGMTPSYRMEDSMMDEFVDGKRNWADPGHYIEQETKENGEFFDSASDLLKQSKSVLKKPEKSSVKKLLDTVEAVIRKGGNVLKGIYKHLEEPAVKPDLNHEPKKPPKAPGKKKTFNLEGTVDHYTDMLKESSGDEKKTLSLLKEFFNSVKPALDGDQAVLASRRVASVFIRTAHANPNLRPALIPFIKRAVGGR